MLPIISVYKHSLTLSHKAFVMSKLQHEVIALWHFELFKVCQAQSLCLLGFSHLPYSGAWFTPTIEIYTVCGTSIKRVCQNASVKDTQILSLMIKVSTNSKKLGLFFFFFAFCFSPCSFEYFKCIRQIGDRYAKENEPIPKDQISHVCLNIR